MRTVAGIFQSPADAERAVDNIRTSGIAGERISLLAPGTSARALNEDVPTTETEQPGMGKALGGTVGGAMGVASGATLGAAAASLFVPGVGPVLAAGIIGAALFGASGVAAGMVAGDKIEDNIAPGLPEDELYVYEDALRQGRSVVIVMAESDEQGDTARALLAQAGAESLDAARESWWVGLRDAAKEEYDGQGSDFKTDETSYRRGFEAALHPRHRRTSYVEAAPRLRESYGEECDKDAFRRGYERGHAHRQELEAKYRQ